MSVLYSLSALMVIFPHTALGSSELAAFQHFSKEFNKSYKDHEEFQYRFSVFSKNLDVATRLAREELGTAEYGVTKFSDLTDEEFRRNYLNTADVLPPSTLTESRVEAKPVLPSCDWRKAGVISRVKNQNKCGSCWAFASVANIEAQYAIRGKPMNLSVQQLLDCGPCEAGCKGAYGWDAYMTIRKEGGLVTEKDYPYEGISKQCRSETFKRVGDILDFIMLPKNEHEMASYVGKEGTISVCINATLLKYYKKGILNPPTCSPNIDHMVLLVGYGTDKGFPYWIAKNSWGSEWGENGYFRINRGRNVCGISKYPLSAIVPGKQKITCPK